MMKNNQHVKGLNMTVAFARFSVAFEDTILMDLEEGLASGYAEGDKIWIGYYGFKGTIK